MVIMESTSKVNGSDLIIQGWGKLTSKPVKGSDLMIGCWNFSMRVGGLKSFLLGSDLTRIFIIHDIIIHSHPWHFNWAVDCAQRHQSGCSITSLFTVSLDKDHRF